MAAPPPAARPRPPRRAPARRRPGPALAASALTLAAAVARAEPARAAPIADGAPPPAALNPLAPPPAAAPPRRPPPEPNLAGYYADRGRFFGLLAGWSALSAGSGAALWASGDRFARYAGIQFVAWGAVDGVVAAAGLARLPAERRGVARDGDFAKERAKFRRVLLVNALVDVAYVTAGALLLGLGRNDAVRGTGAGVAAQGAFLLAFDGGGLLYFP